MYLLFLYSDTLFAQLFFIIMNRQPVIVDCGSCGVPPPPPVDIEVLNCDGTTTTQTFPAAPSAVEIIQTKPFVICATPQIDIEHRTICNETTNTWHYITVVYTDGVVTSNTSLDSGIPCSDPLPLEPDIEQLRRCDATTNTIWIDVVRYMTNPTTNVTTSSILSSVDTLEKCNEVEIDYIHTNWLPICVGGVQWYVAEEYSYNNTTAVKTLIGKIYKEGANGLPTNTSPLGVITDGDCPCISTPQGVLVNW